MTATLEELLPQVYKNIGSEPRPPSKVYERLALVARLLQGAPPAAAGARRLLSTRNGSVIAHDLGEKTVIGRDPACEVVVGNARASRRHCSISSGGAEDRLVDLRSKNGTFVNGARVARRVLVDGDVIEVGGTVFVYTNK